MANRLQLRRGLAADWATYNPILAEGELAVELDTSKFKIGDGIHAWSFLAYSSGIQGETGPQGETGQQGPVGITELPLTLFEVVNKNLKSSNYTLNYTGNTLTSVSYSNGITKSLNYTNGILSSIVLTGTVLALPLTKTFTYNAQGVLISCAYS
jgi:hypothetical protein